jgi:hypothetical protein
MNKPTNEWTDKLWTNRLMKELTNEQSDKLLNRKIIELANYWTD